MGGFRRVFALDSCCLILNISAMDSLRMQKLREVLAHAMDSFLAGAQNSLLVERCFPKLAKTHGDIVLELLSQALTFVKINGLVSFVALESLSL